MSRCVAVCVHPLEHTVTPYSCSLSHAHAHTHTHTHAHTHIHTYAHEQKLREKYGFDEYLILTQIVKRGVCDTNSTNSVEDADETDKKIGAAQGGWKDSEGGGVTWVKAEEEAFLKCSHADFEFELSIAPDGNGVIFGKVSFFSYFFNSLSFSLSQLCTRVYLLSLH